MIYKTPHDVHACYHMLQSFAMITFELTIIDQYIIWIDLVHSSTTKHPRNRKHVKILQVQSFYPNKGGHYHHDHCGLYKMILSGNSSAIEWEHHFVHFWIHDFIQNRCFCCCLIQTLHALIQDGAAGPGHEHGGEDQAPALDASLQSNVWVCWSLYIYIYIYIIIYIYTLLYFYILI